MNPKKIDQIGCIDIGSNAIKYKQFRIIAGDNQNYSKELETYKRIPIRLGTDAFRKGKIRKKTINKLTESLEELVSSLDSKKINSIHSQRMVVIYLLMWEEAVRSYSIKTLQMLCSSH